MTELEVNAQGGGGGAGVVDHALLIHLSYATAGHTGFSPTIHGHVPGDIAPQGAGSNLDADKVDGQHAAAFAAAVHGHVEADVAGLVGDLAGKAPIVHGHTPADIAPQGALSTLDADLVDGQHAAAFALAAHTHPEGDVTNLVVDLAAKAPTARNINTTAPLAGGGDLSADRTLSIPKATAAVDGYLDHTDWSTFNGKGTVGPIKLTGAASYYVRTDGSDLNDGSANDAAHAWLTVQHAVDYIIDKINLNGYNVAINIAAGTYVGAINILTDPAGAGYVYIQGDVANPENVILDSNNATGTIYVTHSQKFIVRYVRITASGGAGARMGVVAYEFGCAQLSHVSFGTCGSALIYCSRKSLITVGTGSIMNIRGDATYVFYAELDSTIYIITSTMNLIGARTFQCVAIAAAEAVIKWLQVSTWTGALTGQRYSGSMLSAISTGTANVNWIPGTVPGALSTGSQYD